MESSEKIKLLNEKYGLFGKEIEEEVDEMCDYGEYMYGRGMKAGERRGEARGITIGEARGITIGEARGIPIGEARGAENMVFNMLRKKLISVEVAARELNMTESEVRRRLGD